jgi:hypothetical protein
LTDHKMRPAAERQRCGIYYDREGRRSWGDHRVTLPGTTCEETGCTVKHHPTILPGWAEPYPDFHERPGVQPIAAAFEGWDAAGMVQDQIGSITAYVAAHVAMDALRDAGYRIIAPAAGPFAPATARRGRFVGEHVNCKHDPESTGLDPSAAMICSPMRPSRLCDVCDQPINGEDVETIPPGTTDVVHVCCWYGGCDHPRLTGDDRPANSTTEPHGPCEPGCILSAPHFDQCRSVPAHDPDRPSDLEHDAIMDEQINS